MKRITTIAVVCLVLGAGAFVVHERRQMAALDARQRELAAAVEQAQRAAQASRGPSERVVVREVVANPEARAAETPPAEPSSTAPEPSPKAPPPLEPVAYAEHLDSSFADEREDPVWARRASEVATNRLREHGDASIRSIECHSSMCRLVTDDAGRDLAWKQIRTVIGGPGDEVWSGAYFSRIEEDGRGQPTRVTYLFRTGAQLPVL